MANRLSQEKANAIAAEYVTNGFRGTEALIACGYSRNYAEHGGLKLFVNDRVKQAIARIQAECKAKGSLTVQEVLDDLAWGIAQAKEKGDLVAFARFSELRGKYLAMFTDKHINDNVNHDDVSTSERDALSDLAAEYARKRTIKLHEPKTEAVNE